MDHDIPRIIRTLSAHTGVDIVPKDTLIVIDEIQESAAALGCLKYFKEDFPQYDVAVAGSLLGISIHEDQSFPVGMVELVRMFPMSLHEFLNATGNEKLTQLLLDCDWAAVNTLSQKYIDLLRQYYYVGGMPEAVAGYIEGKGLGGLQKRLLQARPQERSSAHRDGLGFPAFTPRQREQEVHLRSRP